eukprot:1258260-Pleurochrysis_carterae.AAC.1
MQTEGVQEVQSLLCLPWGRREVAIALCGAAEGVVGDAPRRAVRVKLGDGGEDGVGGERLR